MVIDLRSNKIFTLKQKLDNTDYKIHKYTEGILSEEEFQTIKSQRQSWRDEINRLQNLTEEQAKVEGLIIEVELQKPVVDDAFTLSPYETIE